MRIYYSSEESNNGLKYHYRKKCKWINNIDPDNLRSRNVDETSSAPPDTITIGRITYVMCGDCAKYSRTPNEISEDVRVTMLQSLESDDKTT